MNELDQDVAFSYSVQTASGWATNFKWEKGSARAAAAVVGVNMQRMIQESQQYSVAVELLDTGHSELTAVQRAQMFAGITGTAMPALPQTTAESLPPAPAPAPLPMGRVASPYSLENSGSILEAQAIAVQSMPQPNPASVPVVPNTKGKLQQIASDRVTRGLVGLIAAASLANPDFPIFSLRKTLTGINNPVITKTVEISDIFNPMRWAHNGWKYLQSKPVPAPQASPSPSPKPSP